MEKVTIIVPAAGKSTRFPNNKPKYLLYDYKGTLMIKNAVRSWMDPLQYNIVIGILAEHDKKYDAAKHIQKAIPFANIVVLDEETLGPADTVYQTIKKLEDELPTGRIFIKDCDSFFDCEVGGNYIAVSSVQENPNTKYSTLIQKSFVTTNENGVILSIVEKEVVSPTFCVGGYGFYDYKVFMSAFEEIHKKTAGGSEIFVSDVVEGMMDKKIGSPFVTVPVTNYVDVGTEDQWNEYNDKPVIFCDIDGTVMKAQSRFGDYSYSSDPIPLIENIEALMRYEDQGAQIIFVTARPLEYIQETLIALRKLGFEDPQLLCGLNNARRILINDYNSANPYPRAEAINIPRDSDTLKEFL